jgi:predicted PurR-regulated permease PerM
MAKPARAATLRPIEPAPEPVSAASTDAQTTTVRHAGLQGYAIVVLAVVAAVAALRAAEGFVIPILLAVVIALALAPVVRVMSRWIPRSVSAALIVVTFLSLVTLTAYSLADDAAAVAATAPQVSRQLRQALRVATESQQGHLLSQMRRAMAEIERAATESTEWTEWSTLPKGVTPVQVVEPPLDLRGVFWNGWFGLAGMGGQLVIVLFLTYFLLSFGSEFKRKLVKLSGDRLSRRRVTVDVIDQIVDRVARSLLHLIITGVLVGVATWLALAWMGVRYAGLFGIAAGLLNAVPYLGPTVVAFAATLTALVQFGDVGMAALVGGVTIVITTIEGLWLTPVLFGRLARVNPAAVLVSALFWGWLWGAAGLLLSLPLLVIVSTIAQSVDDLTSLAELLGE